MKKNASEIKIFIKTFIIAFAAFLITITPVTAVLQVLDSNPGGENASVLADEMEMDVLFDEDSPFFDAFTNAYRRNPVNTAKAVYEIFMGIPINYYIVMDYESVAKVVDTMGGVPMNIPFRMKYSDPYDKPPLYIDIPKGETVLYGKQAMQFLRFRHGDLGYQSYPDADLGRIKAQQTFMINAFKKCIGFDMAKIAAAIYDNITSDMKLKTVLYIAQKSIGITGDDIKTYTMPGKADTNSPFYVYPKAEEISEMLTEIYSIQGEQDAV